MIESFCLQYILRATVCIKIIVTINISLIKLLLMFLVHYIFFQLHKKLRKKVSETPQ